MLDHRVHGDLCIDTWTLAYTFVCGAVNGGHSGMRRVDRQREIVKWWEKFG